MGFKENLKEQLSFSGMYVKELAAKSGVKKHTIDSYLSTHNCMPSADAAVAIARVLGVSVEYLITGKEKTGKHSNDSYAVVELLAKMNEKNRRMAITVIKAIKKQEEEEKKNKSRSSIT